MSYIEFKENAIGQLIAFEDEKSLASQRDPVSEAKKWVQELKITDRKVIVLGLGSGYHIAQLILSGLVDFVTVVDSRSQLIAVFRAEFPDLQSKIEIKIFDSEQAVLSDLFMSQVADEALQVLCFRPAWGSNEKLFSEFFKLLTGRSKVAVDYILKKYGFATNPTSIEEIDNKMLSIKDLSLLIDTANEGHPQASVIKILRELVI